MKEANRPGTPVIPWTSLTDFNQLATTPGVLFVDKTRPWRRCHEQYRVPIVRRPRGYGKTTLLAMLAALHDVRRTDVTFLEGSDAPECLVLEFDMNHSTLITSSAQDFQSTLNKYVLDTLTNFMQKYKEYLGLTEEQIQDCCRNFPTNGSCIIAVMKFVKKSDWPIFLSIDNYNAPILEKNVHALKRRLEEILGIHFYQFVEGYIIPQAEAGLIVGGILPEGLAQTCYHLIRHFGLGRCDGSWDCTESKFAQEMFGLTKAQVRTLDTVINPNGSPRGPDILKDLKFLRIVPRQFATDGDWSTEAAMFSMEEVLKVISLRSGMPRQ
ncbi:hypothetical protein ARMGADRAFT_661158 [Armillaria gallica]|uniref:AAA-ATPase-like domain-containing protein n=1 Tax=Armillaria gallica TaxID=47427 RepID=A0A2H3E2I6_ARMGA|nr:hypothetical protein ARMGADRAFT_661158 [Armillaria gallica]